MQLKQLVMTQLQCFNSSGDIISVHDPREHPAVPRDVYEPSNPQPKEHILAQEFQFIRFVEPQSLRTNPHAEIPNGIPPRDGQPREEQREQEEVPQEVL
jgi:hypothetical protein